MNEFAVIPIVERLSDYLKGPISDMQKEAHPNIFFYNDAATF
ncbi:MAG: hypothetical protein JWN76_2165 [Chitinophagaceae bacterium]|nr:hypothetical protein [Chitinophagaceae bacterium]